MKLNGIAHLKGLNWRNIASLLTVVQLGPHIQVLIPIQRSTHLLGNQSLNWHNGEYTLTVFCYY